MIKAVTGLTTWMKGLNPSTLKTTLGYGHHGDDETLGMLRENGSRQSLGRRAQ